MIALPIRAAAEEQRMDHIRVIAYETVMRACLFGALAIFCVMVGLSFAPYVAFQTGAFLTAGMALILVYKAHEARTKDHRRMEMWLYLPKEHRPPAAAAQRISATVMREVYLTFARWTAWITLTLCLAAMAAKLAGL
jgi:hypothetical protein